MGSLTKGMIGKQDINFKASGTTEQSFDRTSSTGGTVSLSEIDAAHIQFRSIAKAIEDLVDAGYDVVITPQEVKISGGLRICSGSGTPEAVETAPIGSLFLNTATPGTTYVKRSGVGNTGWTPLGKVIQVARDQDGERTTTNNIIPFDDSIPQITEGGAVLSVAITPKSATNNLYIQVTVFVTADTASRHLTVALFKAGQANALAAGTHWITDVDGFVPITFDHKMAAGVTTELTFSVRIGQSAAGWVALNGNTAERYLGGVFASSLTVMEVEE